MLSVVGHWLSLELESPEWKSNFESAFSKRTKFLVENLEKALDDVLIDGGLLAHNFIRTQVIQFKKIDETSTGALLDVHFAPSSQENALNQEDFLDLVTPLLFANTSIGNDIVLNKDCNSTNCPIMNRTLCDTAKLSTVPGQSLKYPSRYHLHKYITQIFVPFQQSTEPIEVGDTIGITCNDPLGVKKFFWEDPPEQPVERISIVCLPNGEFTVPKVFSYGFTQSSFSSPGVAGM